MKKLISSKIFISIAMASLIIILAFYLKIEEGSDYREADRIHGFNLVAPRQPFSIDSLLKVKASGAQWIAIVPYAFCNAANGEITFDHPRQWWGEKPKGIIETINMAQSIGLKIMLKPHLWVGGQGWAGDLDFEEDSMWLKFEGDYENYLMTYAKIADSLDVELLCIGTEIRNSTRQRAAYWLGIINKIKENYKGKLTYAANWDEYEEVSFWSELDYIGIDAYFPLSSAKNPSKEELVIAWGKPLGKMQHLSEKFNKAVLFTEYGYESMDYATAGHWTLNKDSLEVNFDTQKVAFESLYNALKDESWWDGGFIWKWHLTQNGLSQRTIKTYTPQNKPALESISKVFKQK
ncbi:hypothetical protein JKA74_14795 [Marivirga sp. S37H4]|uniref:Glycoside hydrolase n=1 Tax=Marivirga aurantiaca TaxID=2802615 RepID=A0A934X0M5_9BACT|nr:hypothetical protein [Marivirga aurantiaca]MBK6266312.1 hypothetical protein [Marivirga aurantiaca]